ncbi:metallophosphoesterase [Terrimonas sp.]|uniref:ligase-associated DNA damage response endonuclease PdeM n=1 Tax=Terrimonas sp. TaxID=1914338 RepID=UPI000D511194|nr:ligase-associated DNA damage response endonuclease PdeM [Terrimonas sp.]PVD53289.1 metallophosphoesterase [Terrimonas sp.]
MHPPIKHIIHNQTLWLSGYRAIFWEEEHALILADLHFGKTGHFRKAGIGVPQTVYKEDLQRLITLIQFFKPLQLIVVGDMFHSKSNIEHALFERWRNDLPLVEVHLVKGNHDILHKDWYQKVSIKVHDHQLLIRDFVFLHDIADGTEDFPGKYFFCGHIHPGIRIGGIAKQALHLPCFHFEQTCCTLPAFSKFTGMINVRRNTGDKIFAIAEGSVFEV